LPGAASLGLIEGIVSSSEFGSLRLKNTFTEDCSATDRTRSSRCYDLIKHANYIQENLHALQAPLYDMVLADTSLAGTVLAAWGS
jgi:hypothetical protein